MLIFGSQIWVIHSVFSLPLRLRKYKNLKGAWRLSNPTLFYGWGNKGHIQVGGRTKTRASRTLHSLVQRIFTAICSLSPMHSNLILNPWWSLDSGKPCQWQKEHSSMGIDSDQHSIWQESSLWSRKFPLQEIYNSLTINNMDFILILKKISKVYIQHQSLNYKEREDLKDAYQLWEVFIVLAKKCFLFFK